jgi:hypothetical protein
MVAAAARASVVGSTPPGPAPASRAVIADVLSGCSGLVLVIVVASLRF